MSHPVLPCERNANLGARLRMARPFPKSLDGIHTTTTTGTYSYFKGCLTFEWQLLQRAGSKLTWFRSEGSQKACQPGSA